MCGCSSIMYVAFCKYILREKNLAYKTIIELKYLFGIDLLI